jgi:hypothetical protein
MKKDLHLIAKTDKQAAIVCWEDEMARCHEGHIDIQKLVYAMTRLNNIDKMIIKNDLNHLL